jgi:hypothetical protein
MLKFRKTPEGIKVFYLLAVWINRKLRESELTLPQWQAKGYSLSAIGVTKAAALKELEPFMPSAHKAYNAHGDAGKRYASWAEFWEFLNNRAFYFFHRHEGGRIVPAVAEWPGEVSEDGLSLIDPQNPEEDN